MEKEGEKEMKKMIFDFAKRSTILTEEEKKDKRAVEPKDCSHKQRRYNYGKETVECLVCLESWTFVEWKLMEEIKKVESLEETDNATKDFKKLKLVRLKKELKELRKGYIGLKVAMESENMKKEEYLRLKVSQGEKSTFAVDKLGKVRKNEKV